MSGCLSFLHPGVLTGDETEKLYRYAQEQGFAIPAFNCTSSSTVNSVLEGARAVNSPVIIQFSNGGAAFFCGKGIKGENQYSAIQGAIAGAKYVHAVASLYGIPVVLHTDHCAKKLLPWLDGCLDADEAYFKETGKALFSSHMIDLSAEKFDDNIEITKKYLERCNKIGVLLEMEIGVTGGEEDGVDNTGVHNSALYSQPEEVCKVWEELGSITSRFCVAAAFGNVHGVYAPGNVKLAPEILQNAQDYIVKKHSLPTEHPVLFVFHGGSGSLPEEITTAVKGGVVKMNIDTDTQWAYWVGLRDFYEEKKDYLQGQIGNPEGPEKPNKKYYDPRVWVRKSEESMIARVKVAFERLNGCNRN